MAYEAFQGKGIVNGYMEAGIKFIADLPDPDASRCGWQRLNTFLVVVDCSHEAPTKTVSEVYPKPDLDIKSFNFKGLKWDLAVGRRLGSNLLLWMPLGLQGFSELMNT